MKSELLYKSKSGAQSVAYRPSWTPAGMVIIDGPAGSLFVGGDYVRLEFPAVEPGLWWRTDASRMLADVAAMTGSILYDSNGCFSLLSQAGNVAWVAFQAAEAAEEACIGSRPELQASRKTALWQAGLGRLCLTADGGWDVYPVAVESPADLTVVRSATRPDDRTWPDGAPRAFSILNVHRGLSPHVEPAVAMQLLLPADWPGVRGIPAIEPVLDVA